MTKSRENTLSESKSDLREKVQSLLLSWEEYNELGITFPYTPEPFKKGDQEFVYFGSPHIKRDSMNEDSRKVIGEIKESWTRFLQQNKELKDLVVLVEGGKRPVEMDEETALRKHGESGVITQFAHEAGVETASPEPSQNEINNALLETYTREQIFYYEVARHIVQWHRLPDDERGSFESYFRPKIEQMSMRPEWAGFDFSFDDIERIHTEIFPDIPFDPENRDFFYNAINPAVGDGVINRLSRDEDIIRDTHIVLEIQKYWRKGKSIYGVYGGSHVVVQESALRELLT